MNKNSNGWWCITGRWRPVVRCHWAYFQALKDAQTRDAGQPSGIGSRGTPRLPSQLSGPGLCDAGPRERRTFEQARLDDPHEEDLDRASAAVGD